MARLVSKKSFADKAGVSRSAITQATKPGGALAEAAVNDQIDIDVQAAKHYLFKKHVQLAKLITLGYEKSIADEYEAFHGVSEERGPAVKELIKPLEADSEEAQRKKNFIQDPGAKFKHQGFHDKASLVDHYGNKTLNEIIYEFGTDEAFSRYANSLKTIAEIESKKLDLAKKRGEVIDRDLVKRHVFSNLETGNMRLLTDLPGNITRHIISAAKTGGKAEDLELQVRGMISLVLKDIKVRSERALTNA